MATHHIESDSRSGAAGRPPRARRDAPLIDLRDEIAARQDADGGSSARRASADDLVTTDPDGTIVNSPVVDSPVEGGSAAADSARMPAPAQDAHRTLLQHAARFGSGPLMAVGDVAACAVPFVLFPDTQRLVAVFTLFFLGLMGAAGMYRSRLSMSVLDDLGIILTRFVMALSATVTGAFAVSVAAGRPLMLDLQLGYAAATCLLTLVVLKAVVYAFVKHERRTGRIAHPTLIIGAGEVGARIGTHLREHPEYGLRPIGFLDADPRTTAEQRADLPVLGGTDDLTDVLLENRIRTAIVAFSSRPERDVVSVIRTCDRLSCELFVVPRLFEVSTRTPEMDEVWGTPLVRLRRNAYRSIAWRIKRVMDVVLSGLAIILLSPVMAAAALAVRLDGGPGIIFRQERIGVDGRSFTIMKFRSMRPATESESATNWNIAQDSRLSPIGKFLRKTSIDELPQLFNILRGDMSIVGPRPERPHFVQQFRQTYPGYVARHRVPCGLTGWAAVHGLRGDTSIEDRARFDNYYIENWSLWLDITIMLRTVAAVVRGTGG